MTEIPAKWHSKMEKFSAGDFPLDPGQALKKNPVPVSLLSGGVQYHENCLHVYAILRYGLMHNYENSGRDCHIMVYYISNAA